MALLILTASANGVTTYYVAPTGQAGCSQNANSPQGGINNGIACLASGDTLIAKSGTYSGPVNIGNVPNGPSNSVRTTLRAEVIRGALISVTNSGQSAASFHGKSNITLDGFVFDGNNRVGTGGLDLNAQNGLSNITVQNGEIRNVRADDIGTTQGGYQTTAAIGASWTAANVLIRNMYVHDIGNNCNAGGCCNECFGYGIYLSGNGYTLENSEFKNMSGWAVHGYTSGSNSASNNIIRNNYFHDTGGPVLMCQSNNQIYNNILKSMSTIGPRIGPAIQLAGSCAGQPSGNNVVYNNTIYQSQGDCINIGYTSNSLVKNNICYQNGNDAVVVGSGSGNVLSNNLLGTNPLFVNASANDFHLQSTSSPAYNMGANLSSVFTSDYENNPRGSIWDIGAYEYVSAGTPTVTIVATDASAAEAGSDTGTFTFTRTGNLTSSLAVNYTIASGTGNATNGTDYTAITTSVTFPANQSQVTRIITPGNDSLVEGTETVALTLASGTGYTIGSPSQATVNILDDDAPPLIVQSALQLVSVDSQETAAENGSGVNVLDGNAQTFWTTAWSQSNPPPPHTLIVGLNGLFDVQGFRYLPRQDGNPNGTIKNYRFFVSQDGVNWGNAVSTGVFTANTNQKDIFFASISARYVKLIADSEINGNPWTSMAEFNLFGTVANPLPAPWQSQDIGSVGLVGSASYSGSTFTVAGSGADIWYAADAFRYVYQAVNGDCTITARVVTQTNTAAWAKSGVMIRETLAAGSGNAFMLISPGNGLTFQSRATTGGNTINTPPVAGTVPYWVRVVRSGNTFTAYKSIDGISWGTAVGSATITMGANVYIGLAVSSHTNTALCTSTFDNVSATTGSGTTPFVTGQTLGTLRNNFTGAAGFKLTVGSSPMTVTKLGRWIVSGNTGTHTVKLVAATSGADLNGGAVSVATSGAPAGQFKYVALASPVTLSANTAYYIVSLETNLGDSWYNWNTTLTHTSQAVINNSVYSANPANGPWTLSGAANNSYVPVSFMTSP